MKKKSGVRSQESEVRPPVATPEQIAEFLGAERFAALVKQAEARGFTEDTLVAAAIDRAGNVAASFAPAVVALHLIRLAGSAPTRADAAKYKAALDPDSHSLTPPAPAHESGPTS